MDGLQKKTVSRKSFYRYELFTRDIKIQDLPKNYKGLVPTRFVE